jgi:hypothetical protein
MPDDRTLELLNLEIDGELSAADRADLSRRLLNDPLARAARDDLRRTCEELDAMPVAEPPAGLRERILAGLPLAANGGGQPSRRFLSSASTLRYAAAIVGALLVGTVAFEASRYVSGVDTDQAVGTMSSPPAPQPGQGQLRVNASQVRGTVTFAPSAGELRVRFDFDATQPSGAAGPGAIDVVVVRGHDQAHLQMLAATQQTLAATLPGAVVAGEAVDVRVVASGLPVYEGRWQVPAAR